MTSLPPDDDKDYDHYYNYGSFSSSFMLLITHLCDLRLKDGGRNPRLDGNPSGRLSVFTSLRQSLYIKSLTAALLL